MLVMLVDAGAVILGEVVEVDVVLFFENDELFGVGGVGEVGGLELVHLHVGVGEHVEDLVRSIQLQINEHVILHILQRLHNFQRMPRLIQPHHHQPLINAQHHHIALEIDRFPYQRQRDVYLIDLRPEGLGGKHERILRR